MEGASVDLISIDPPFNTGKTRARAPIKTARAGADQPGDRTGFARRRYASARDENHPTRAYADSFAGDDFLAFLERIITVHSNPGDLVLDFFAGSGTTGEAALRHGRRCILVDENPQALEVMESRLARWLEPAPADS